MKRINRLCLLAPLGLLCLSAQAQDYSMVVNTIEGNSAVYPTSQVESVVFTDEPTEPVTPSTKIQMKRNIVFLGHSIWRNDNYYVKYQNSGSFVTPFTGTFKANKILKFKKNKKLIKKKQSK